MNAGNVQYNEFISDKEALAILMTDMATFDRRFCEAMMNNSDFTLSLEVHGAAGRLIHSKVEDKAWKRPSGSERGGEKKKK